MTDVSSFSPIPLEPEGQGIQSPVIRSAKPRLINDYMAALRNTETNYFIKEDGEIVNPAEYPEMPITRSALVIPLLLKKQVIGTIQIQSAEKNAYTEQDLQLAELLAAQVSMAINNAGLYQQSLKEIEERRQAEESLRQHLQRREKISELGRALSATLDLPTIYCTAEKYLREMADCPNVGVSLFDERENLIRAAYVNADGVRIDVHLIPPLSYHADQATGGRALAIRSREPVIVCQVEQRRQQSGGMIFGDERLPQCAIYIPMIVEGKVIGLLELQSYQADAYFAEDGRWLSLVANQIGLAIQNARLFSLLQSRVAELVALHEVDSAVTAHLGQQQTFDILLDQVVIHLGADAADILLFDAKTQQLLFASGIGFYGSKAQQTRVYLSEGLAGQVAQKKDIVYRLDLSEEDVNFLEAQPWAEEGVVAYVGAPLIVEQKILGVLEVFFRSPISPDENWMRFLETLVGQSAITVEHTRLFDQIRQMNEQLLKAYDATIAGWSHAMDLRDKETEGHSLRVTRMTERLAVAIGVAQDQLIHIRRGALLHDIGKLGVPDAILFKAGELTPDEWRMMQKHPQFAYEMLSNIEYLRPALDIPYCHHEKWDGSGYPRGLKGEEIPLAARIFALADIWDALRSDRPYRSAWPLPKVLEYILSLTGSHLDPAVVGAFATMLETDSTWLY